MATTSNKRSELIVVCNTKQAQDELKKWENELKKAKEDMQKLAAEGKTSTARYQELDRDVKNLSKSIALNRSNMERVNNVLKNLSTSSLRQVRTAIRDVKKELDKMSETDPRLKQTQENLRKLQEQMAKLKGETKAAGDSMASAWNKTAKAVASYLGVTMVLGKVKTLMTELVTLNLKYSDQLADIRKVSGLATQDINKLSENLAKIDTRTSLQEMAQIAYSGAKLGMGKYGIEGLESFTNAANQVNVALKEDLGQDALTALSKMVEVMGLIPKMGVEQSLLATGSAMFQLAATSTADAGAIVEFAKRLTGMSRAAGITTDQLLALGSASSSMALMPEVASTALSKLITSLQTSHNLIEESLNIEKGTISKLFETGHLMDAIVLVFERLQELGNMNAIDEIFKDLGSDGARLKAVVVTMSQNIDMLKEHLQTSEVAFREATAVTNEYNIQQETAQALMERASHAWEKAFVNPEGVDVMKSMAQAWFDISKSMTESTVVMTTLKAAFVTVITTIKVLLNLLPALLVGLMFRGVIGSLSMIKAGMDGLATSTFMATRRTEGLATAWRTLNAAQKANAIATIITLVAGAGMAMYDLMKKTRDATTYMKDFNSSLEDVVARTAEVQSEAVRYKEAIERANVGTRERASAIKNFNDKFGAYYSNMLTEKSTAEDIAAAYKEVCNQLERKAVLEMKEGDVKKYYNPRVGWAAQRLYEYGEVAEKSGTKQFNATWLKGIMDDRHSVQSVVEYVAKALSLSQEDVDLAMSYANSKSIPTKRTELKGNFGSINGRSSVQTTEYNVYQQMLIGAARAAAQEYSAQHTMQKINKKYDPYAKLLVEEPEPPKKLGQLENEKADPEAAKAAKAARNAQQKAWREELKQAQDEARAIMDNIKNFYERQMTEVYEKANEMGWDQQLLKSAVDAIVARENLALMNARKSISDVKNEWDTFKQTMQTDMVETADELGYNQSQGLLDQILNTNTEALRKKMESLTASLSLPSNAATDAIWKNATLNEKANETATQKKLRARQQKLLEDNYTAKVDNQYLDSMTQLGYFNVNSEQSQTLADASKGTEAMEKAQLLITQRAKDIENVFKTTREHIVELLNIGNVATDEGKNKLMTILFGENWESSDTELKEVLALSKDDVQLFYDELLKYYNDYTDAQKKASDRQEKLLTYRYEHRERTDADNARQSSKQNNELLAQGVAQFHPDNQTAIDKEHAKVNKDLPKTGVYGKGTYMESFGYDAEVESYRMKIEAAQMWYDFLKKNQAEEYLMREAEIKILQAQMDYAKSVASQMKKQMDEVYQLAAPIEQFGTAMGKAFATMTEDAEAGRKALKEAVGDMINSMLKQTVTMTEELIKRRMMQEINDRLTSSMMRKSAKEQQQITENKGEDTSKAEKKAGKQVLKTVEGSLEDQLDVKMEETAKEAKVEKQAQTESEAVVQEGEETKSMLKTDLQTEATEAVTDIQDTALATQKTQATEEVNTESQKAQANTMLGISDAAAKIIGKLGWWGIPLVAVVTALLNGLLSAAMSKISSLFGGGGSSDDGGTTKLVTGMLTYDAGNVQAFRGVTDGKSYPVVGDDGKVYAATDGGELSTGLVKDPITTLVNGQPALVAERGPEMVIGRETTAAMMMARPDILAEIVKFDRNRSGQAYRAYDEGNVSDFNINVDGGTSAETLASLQSTIATLSTVLSAIQQNGIAAHVNKYGKGGLVESAQDGISFMKKNSSDRRWRN